MFGGEGHLSQEEMDALLSGTDTFDTFKGFDIGRTVDTGEGLLTEVDRANLTELFRQILEAKRNLLKTQTGREISVSGLTIDTFDSFRLSSEIVGEVVDVKFNISGNLTGEIHFIYPSATVLAITNPLIGDEANTILTDLVINTFEQNMSIVISNFTSTLSERIGRTLAAGSPTVQKLPDARSIPLPNIPMVMLSFSMSVGNRQGKVYFVFPQNTAKQMIISYTTKKMPEVERTTSKYKGEPEEAGKLVVRPVEFGNLEEVSVEAEGSLALILDIPVQITVELGRTKMLVKEVLQLGEGSVVELDKLAGEPVDIMVNGRLIAKGEVVVIEENFGVRITEIVNHIDRMFKYSDRG
ncbi:MAG: flagellar motor switch protein FliN [Spirochaetia bacterium]|nr:flagellar motor switch protein FliN [Spirochaetota bacterium]MDW8112572.1 flagellar motor switch protein FliN [Spirochaetia bacterium]